MARIWAIAPYNYDKPERFDEAWGYCQRNGVIAIGWHLLGDLSGKSRAQIMLLYQDEPEYRYNPETGNESSGYRSLQRFWHDIEIGDRVIARAGRKKIVGLGVVTGKPLFNGARGKEMLQCDPHPNFIGVSWENFSERRFQFEVLKSCRATVNEIKKHHTIWPKIRSVLWEVWDLP